MRATKRKYVMTFQAAKDRSLTNQTKWKPISLCRHTQSNIILFLMVLRFRVCSLSFTSWKITEFFTTQMSIKGSWMWQFCITLIVSKFNNCLCLFCSSPSNWRFWTSLSFPPPTETSKCWAKDPTEKSTRASTKSKFTMSSKRFHTRASKITKTRTMSLWKESSFRRTSKERSWSTASANCSLPSKSAPGC